MTSERRHRRGDIIVVVAFAVMALLTVAVFAVPEVIWYSYPPGSPMAHRVTVMGLVVAVVGAALLWWRSRFPVTITFALALFALISLLTTGGSGATTIGMALAMHEVAVRRGPVVTWTTALVTWIAVGIGTWHVLSVNYVHLMGLAWTTMPAHLDRPPGDRTPQTWTGTELAQVTSEPVRLTAVITVAAMMLLAIALGTSSRLQAQRLAAQAERERALLEQAEHEAELVRATERTHIAREVHDVVAHSVSVMVALADGADAVTATDPQQARTAMREVSQTGRAALAEMKHVLLALDDAPAADSPHDDTLEVIVSRFRMAGLAVEGTGLQTPLPTPIAQAARRIVAESLTNVLRHAPASTEVQVQVAHERQGVLIEVVNTAAGTGPASATGAGRGLVGMRERVDALGGSLTVGPVGSTWRVRARLPIDDAGTTP